MDEIARALFARLAGAARRPASSNARSPCALNHEVESVAAAYGTFMARTTIDMDELVSQYTALRAALDGTERDGSAAELHRTIDDSLRFAAKAFLVERERNRQVALDDVVHRMRGRLNVIGLVGEMWRDAVQDMTESDAEIVLRQVEFFEPLFSALRATALPATSTRTAVDLRVLCTDVVEGAADAPVMIEGPTGLFVVVDVFRLREAIGQMLRQAAAPHAKATLRVEDAGAHARIEVSSDAPLVEDTAGTPGNLDVELGWLLAAQTAEAHGGILIADAVGLRLTLPRHEADATPPA